MEDAVHSGSAIKLVQRTYGRKRPRVDGEECAVAYPAAVQVGHHTGSLNWDASDVNVSAASLHSGSGSTSVASPFLIHSLCHTNLASEGDGQLPDLVPASKQTSPTYGTQQSDPVGADADSIDQLGDQIRTQIVPSPPLLLSTPVSTTASSASSFCTATTHSCTGKGAKAGLITSFFSGSGGLLSLPPGISHNVGQRYAATPSLVRPRAGGRAGEGDGKRHGLAQTSHRAGGSGSGSGSSAISSPAPALLQLHLDLGQHTLGSITCPACGMLYTPGLQVDEQSHALYCARKGTGEGAGRGQAGSMPTACISFPGWKHARWVTPAFPPSHPPSPMRILHLTQEDVEGAHPGVRSKIAEVDELLARVLGAESAPTAGGDVSRFWAIGSMPGLLAVGQGQGQGGGTHGGGSQAVLGVVAVQRLGEAQRARRIKAEWSADSDRVKLSIAGGAVCERAVLGVAQVWVHPSARRRGVASILLDAARAHAVWAYPVPLSELAFTQPTQEGYILAARYTGTEAFLVY